jgi:hypothetical protein
VKAVQGDAAKDKTYVSQNTFADEGAASEAFARSVDKLLHVSEWSALSSFTADFSLHTANGQPKANPVVETGDYINIALPGPMPENWVRVVDLSAGENRAEFTVQPSPDPGKANSEADSGADPGQIVHFFSQQARSTFRVEKAGTTLTASEIGQHEAINNQQPEAGDRALINTVIAEGGWLFYQKIQWKLLTDYLVHL